MLDFMNAGPLMDEAGVDLGGGGGITTDVATPVSTELATTSGAELATTDADPDHGTDGGDLEVEPFRALENGRPSKATSTALQSLKATHPQLARQIPRALAIEARLRSEFPGVNAFDAIKALRQRIKQLGGDEGIAQIQKDLAEINELDELYAKGDPRMLERMTESPEGKAAFTKLAPHVFSKFESLAPNAFTKYMASVILNDMSSRVELFNRDGASAGFMRLTDALERIAEFTPKELVAPDGAKTPNPAASELQKVNAYIARLQSFEKLASEVLAPAADPKDNDLERQRQELAKEKRGLVLQGWRNAADQESLRIFNQAWTAETKGKTISEVDKEDILARYRVHLPIALSAIPGWKQTIDEFQKADDRDGYLRFMKTKQAEKIPAVLRKEIQRRYPNGTTKKPAAVAAAPGTTARAQVEQGFKRVAAMPPMNTVSKKFTTPDMWKHGKAILNSGEKVQWR